MDANNNEDLFPYPGKTSSRVWKYFYFRKVKDGAPVKENLDMSRVICTLCRKSYANKGNTTNLQSHLDKDHSNLATEKPQGKLQPKITASMQQSSHRGKLPQNQQQKLDDLLLRLIVGKCLPLSLVDNPLFRAFISELDPRYCIPSGKSVSTALDQKFEDVQEKVSKEISDSAGISLTHDGWMSMNTESYDTLTAHVINKEWELTSMVLSTKKIEGQHKGENIARNIQETLSRWKINSTPTAITTDNAANEVKAVKILSIPRVGCFGHRINLVVKKSLEIPEVSALVKKGRRLVTFFHQSSSVTDVLLNKQKDPSLCRRKEDIGHKLIMDCVTRWNSTFHMLQRLHEQTHYIMAVASDTSLSKTAASTIKASVYTFEELACVEKLIEILEPFEKATVTLCAENKPTIQKALLVTKAKLTNCLEPRQDDDELIRKLKETMNEQLNKRTESEDLTLLAAILNPDSKSLSFLSESERADALKLLKDHASVSDVKVTVKKETSEEGTVTVSLPTLPTMSDLNSDESDVIVEEVPVPVKKPKIICADADDWLEDVYVAGESHIPVAELVDREITRYMSSARQTTDTALTLLEWWKKNQYEYPRLSKLASRILAIPASSVPSERVFSLAGNLISKKRSRLKPELVNKIIFLCANMKKYW